MTLDPGILMTILELVGYFIVGVVSWSLALYRLLAFERRQENLLSILVFIEEYSLLFLGVWLANDAFSHGLLHASIRAAMLSAGGTLAARFIVRRAKDRDGNTVQRVD